MLGVDYNRARFKLVFFTHPPKFLAPVLRISKSH